MYLAFLILFAFGGITFLWHETMAQSIDDASRKVVAAIFWFSFKLMGYLLMLFGVLSLFLTMLLSPVGLAPAWWVTPVLVFLFGLLLSWCTRDELNGSPRFQSSLMPSTAARMSPPVAKKSAKKKKLLAL